MLKTALYSRHIDLNAKMVPFAGYEMPVSYAGIKQEHAAVRQEAGLFDVSHMGNFYIAGPEAGAEIDAISVNNVASLAVGQVQYSAICKEDGGMLDDILVYRFAEDEYQLIVNAGNKEKIWNWLEPKIKSTFINESTTRGIIALQGPQAKSIASALFDGQLDSMKYYHCGYVTIGGEQIKASATGYTGESGFEFYPTLEQLPKVWDLLLAQDGVSPCGLGARDTLRLESGFSLYGHELNEDKNPIEAGLSWITSLDSADFIGKEVLVAAKEKGVKQKIVGLELLEKGIARQGHEILLNGVVVGEVTSGTMAPSLEKAIAMAYVDLEHTAMGTELEVSYRGRSKKIKVVSRRFYKG